MITSRLLVKQIKDFVTITKNNMMQNFYNLISSEIQIMIINKKKVTVLIRPS